VTAHPTIQISPAVKFGRPHIKGVSCEAIAGLVMAGESLNRVADDYDLSRHEVLLACWHEGIHGGYQDEWGVWAEAVQLKLGGWETFDAEAEAGPPDRQELVG
jgi:uncharacterized protein (DUF433 family)